MSTARARDPYTGSYGEIYPDMSQADPTSPQPEYPVQKAGETSPIPAARMFRKHCTNREALPGVVPDGEGLAPTPEDRADG